MSEHREFNMKTIMVATDLSDASYGARNYARQLARRFSAKVLLVHVIEPSRPGMDQSAEPLSQRIDFAEDQLQKMASALHFDDVHCAIIVRTGDIRETIANLITERNADLLILGTRSKDHKPGDALGSVAEKLVRGMPCPVLTVGKYVRQDSLEKTHPCTVLFPTDFSEISRAALAYTECLTKDLGGHLCLLHVDDSGVDVASPPAREADFERQMARMKDPSLVSQCITRKGKPAEVIAAVSIEKWADFIVMGVHGTEEMDKSRKYRIAYDVIRSVRCPVFTLFVCPQEAIVKSEHSRSTVSADSAALMSKTS